MDGKGTERQLRKMPHLLSPVTLLLIALSVLIGCSQVDGRVCHYGQERDPKSEGKLRWIMPSKDHEDRCSCTRIKPGGVNPTFTKMSTDGAKFTDKPLFTGDEEKIRKRFNCSDTGTSTNQPSVTINPEAPATTPATTHLNPQTTTTEVPTTITEVPLETTDPPTTTTEPGHADCQALLDAGHSVSGVYNITPAQYPDGLEVYCDMTTDSKGWIVFQRRVNGTVNFTRSWAEYGDGFGDEEGAFWLGNEILRRLTEPLNGTQKWKMRVDLVTYRADANFYGTGSGVYDDFHVDGENYTLHVGALTDPTNLGDCLAPTTEPPSNGQPFSTYDRDNDAESFLNCADELKGGWWFNRCTPTDPEGDDNAGPHSNLNGEYSQTSANWVYGRGIVWSNVNRITRSEMKMRRCL